MFLQRFALGALWTNGYLVLDYEGRGFFVDPGGNPREVIQEMERKGVGLEYVLLTHGHADHIGGLSGIRHKAARGVLIHEDDALMLSRPEANLSIFVGEKAGSAASRWTVQDGDILTAGKLSVKVTHPGTYERQFMFSCGRGRSILFLFLETPFLRSRGVRTSPGRRGNSSGLSWKNFRSSRYNKKLLPGHGPETTIGEEKTRNPFWPGRSG